MDSATPIAFRRAFTAAMLLALNLVAGCPMRALPGQPPLVGVVHVSGNKAVSAGDLVPHLALAESGFQFAFKFGDEVPFDPDVLRVDRMRMERLYQSYGYFDARVVHVDTHVAKGRVDITFTVVEGPPTRVAKLEFTGLDGTPDWVPKYLPVRAGDVFREDRYAMLKEALVTRMKEAGYWDSKDEGHVVIDQRQRTADITIGAAPGTRYVVGTLSVDGTRNVSTVRILDAADLHAGAPLAPSKLLEARRNVSALGVFSQVTVKPATFDQAHGTASVLIHVVEAPFQNVAAGAGIEINPSEELARLKASYTNLNLGRDLQKLVISASIGYAFLPDIFTFISTRGHSENGIIGDLTFEYVQPRLFRWPVDGVLGIGYTKDLTPAFTYQRVGAKAGLVFHFPGVRGLSLAPSIHYDYYFDVNAGTVQATVAGAPATPINSSGCGPSLAGTVTSTCRIGYFDVRLTYDLRDDPLEPRKGAYFSIGTQYANQQIADFGFFQVNPEIRGYVPVPFVRSLTLAARVHYGLLRQTGGGRAPPGLARFFGGGADSVRAAGTEQLGPRDFLDLPSTHSWGLPYLNGMPVPVGGDEILEGSVELRWFTPIAGLGIAAFFDIGSLALTENNSTPNTSGGLQYGPGIGFRYRTPLGPLRLDFAWRLSNEDAQPVAVDTTNIPNAAKVGIPTSVFGAGGVPNYSISTACRLSSGPNAYQCYNDPRFQFYLTLGEPY